jgi:hypothetical protein
MPKMARNCCVAGDCLSCGLRTRSSYSYGASRAGKRSFGNSNDSAGTPPNGSLCYGEQNARRALKVIEDTDAT